MPRQELLDMAVETFVLGKRAHRAVRDIGRKLTENEYRACEVRACEIVLEETRREIRKGKT